MITIKKRRIREINDDTKKVIKDILRSFLKVVDWGDLRRIKENKETTAIKEIKTKAEVK